LEENEMKFFADTAEVKDIKELHELGLLDGITTNPSLIAKSGRQIKDVIREICEIVPGPVSAEVASTTYDQMLAEGTVLAAIASNVVVKVPLTLDGLKACKTLSGRGTKVNVTLCFSANQALLAAKCGATYISPFIGRLDDINIEGMELITDIRTIYDNYAYTTEILAASIRSPNHVTQAALAGADVATIPPAVIKKLADHPLTKLGLDAFVKDWASTGQSIL
jgi:transaldolase